MHYPFFALQTPVTPMQENIDRFINSTISKDYSGITTRRLFGVPVSQLYNPEYIRDGDVAGRDFGKIAVLVVDMIDYSPLCAILIGSASEQKVNQGVESLLNEARLPWVKVHSSNMEDKVRGLLHRAIGGSSSTLAKKTLNETEQKIARYYKKMFNQFPEDYRVMEQVGLSEVVETLNLDHRNLHKPKNWKSPQTYNEFKNLDINSQYYKLIDFASRSSLDLLFINKDPFSQSKEWWPVLAVEIDGNQHRDDEHQKLKDSLKDRICQEALLPLLRIKLYESSHSIRGLATNLVNNIPRPAGESIVFELINFLVFEGIKNGKMSEQNKRREERRKLIDKMRRIQVLMSNGLSLDEAVDIYQMENAEQLEADWIEEVADRYADEGMKKRDREQFELKYRAMYGKTPSLNVSVTNDGVLTGRLGSLELPKVKCICTFFGNDMRDYLLKFGEEWLIRESVYSEKIQG